jgi:chemotaxis protein methyltransferase CheR
MDLATYAKVKQSILSILKINLDFYKDEQMRRRLDSWLSRVGASDWDSYFLKVKSDEVEWRKLRDYITINVTEFFRDFERWKALKDKVITSLLSPRKPLRIWSAGCSKGAEIFSITMILEEMDNARNHYLLATDLDRGALEIAQNGGPFLSEEVRNVSPMEKSIYFRTGGPPFFVKDQLVNKVKFREQDLLREPFESGFDLVVCRNVVIYFTMDTKQMLYEKFCQSLRPGGVLFVGGTEIIPHPQDIGLKNSGFSFYYKI